MQHMQESGMLLRFGFYIFDARHALIRQYMYFIKYVCGTIIDVKLIIHSIQYSSLTVLLPSLKLLILKRNFQKTVKRKKITVLNLHLVK